VKITVLGSGTSQGVPIIGCSCPTCISTNPKDKRLRVSVHIQTASSQNGKPVYLLIDTSPDFRQQMLVNGLSNIDAIIYTHAHVDHIMGLDDIRQINQLHWKTVDVFSNEKTLNKIRATFSYIFDPNTYKGGGIPNITLHTITLDKFTFNGIEIIPIEYFHGPTRVFGYRIGGFAYLTDCSMIPEKEFPKLENLEVMIIDALRYRKHETHFSIDEAVEVAQRLNPKMTYFTHMTHDVLHDEANEQLPENIELSYDGLTFEIP